MAIQQYLRVDPNTSIPLATQLSQQITWLIASGEIKEGEQLPPVRKLAEDLGINFHTVRAAYQKLEADGLVINRRGTRATVRPYDRHHQAARTPDLPTFTIGILVPNYSPYYAAFLDGIEEATRDDPWLFFICDTNYYSRNVGRYMDQFVAKNVDGIIITHFETPYISDLKTILSPSDSLPPIVYADSLGMEGPGIAFNREGGGFQATNHLLKHGHQRIGMITPPLEWSSMKEVFRGYKRALRLSGLPVSSELIATVPSFSLEAGAQAANQLLDLRDPPTAIFTTGDILAAGAMQSIKGRGLQISEDIALVGYGEIDLAILLEPPLTTVSLPAYEMGLQVISMLRNLINGKAVKPRRLVIDTHLVIRQSCGCSP